MSKHPSRTVTKCVVCGARFTPRRSDAKYCSAACRQSAHRARAELDALDREIEAARLRYWSLLEQKARAVGEKLSQVVTDEAQWVEEDGTVHMGGRVVGKVTPNRPGWDVWGLEAAGPPFMPPPHNPPQQPNNRRAKP